MPRQFLPLLLVLSAVAACSGGAGVGATCAAEQDCAPDLQCFEQVCVPRCDHHADCGDGYLCTEVGACEVVVSAVGDPCARERDCAPGQLCALDDVDRDGDGLLGATCQPQEAGNAITGAACEADADCRHATCVLGVCTEVCERTDDCPAGSTCAEVPRLAARGARFAGCLPSEGVLAHSIAASSPSERLALPVPGHARSFAVVSRVADPRQAVGLTRVADPDGAVLYREPLTPGDEDANLLRHQRAPGISTLLVPNSDRVTVEPGVYHVDVRVTSPLGTTGTLAPELTVLYKLDDSKILDLEIVFLDLADHPCARAWGGGRLDASTAPTTPGFQTGFLGTVAAIFAPAGIQIGEVRYRDLARADLDGLSRGDTAALFQLSERSPGITLFFARSIKPDGVQALVGATPGPPRTPGTRASGIVLAADTLCYRGWTDLARVAAHALASQMGLYPNRDPSGVVDPISDSDTSAVNLMHFGEFGGTELSPGQRAVLGGYPGLR